MILQYNNIDCLNVNSDPLTRINIQLHCLSKSNVIAHLIVFLLPVLPCSNISFVLTVIFVITCITMQ